MAAAVSESQIALLSGLLKNLEYAVAHYAPASQEAIAAAAWSELSVRAPGGDAQRLWLRTFAHLAGGTSLGGELQAVYAGTTVPAGVELDFEDALAVGAWAGRLWVDRCRGHQCGSSTRDSNVAAEQYAASRTSAPAGRGGEGCCWRIGDDAGWSRAPLKFATARGFWHPAQLDLLRPYLAKYYASIDDYWATDNGGEQAWVSTKTLAPTVVDDEVAVWPGDGWRCPSGRPCCAGPWKRRCIRSPDPAGSAVEAKPPPARPAVDPAVVPAAHPALDQVVLPAPRAGSPALGHAALPALDLARDVGGCRAGSAGPRGCGWGGDGRGVGDGCSRAGCGGARRTD